MVGRVHGGDRRRWGWRKCAASRRRSPCYSGFDQILPRLLSFARSPTGIALRSKCEAPPCDGWAAFCLGVVRLRHHPGAVKVSAIDLHWGRQNSGFDPPLNGAHGAAEPLCNTGRRLKRGDRLPGGQRRAGFIFGKLGRHGGDLRDLACHEAPITPPRAKIMRHKSRFVAHDVRDLLCTLDIALRTQDIVEAWIPGPNFGYGFLTQFNSDLCQRLRDDRTR